jgi:hypothetical protein
MKFVKLRYLYGLALRIQQSVARDKYFPDP